MVYSGQKSVASTGTAERVNADTSVRDYWFRAHPNNSQDIYIGNDGNDDVSATTGLALRPDDTPIMLRCRLSDLWVDAEVNGETICWLTSHE